LGLAGQRHDVETFGSREGFAVKNWHQNIQTGAVKDALLLRPGLAAAIREARAAWCPLVVSGLDRLSRNVHFITRLMEHKVHFMVAALGRDCDSFTLHIYASLARAIRTNRAYKKWPEIFNNDSTLTSAILDRLLHRCETAVIEGKSYRAKDRVEEP
jgi:DNA invertase Pin-like site-specific DNA recombinase